MAANSFAGPVRIFYVHMMSNPSHDLTVQRSPCHASPDERPYLSVVAASRNDNHGGDLLVRMQLFIDGLSEQCRRHRLPAELLMIEWNPRPDRPKLTEALSWPTDNPFLTTRVIEVPIDLHKRFDYADGLALFQMIAKNVGILRARGRFVLATNIDLLFSDEVFARIARQDLDENAMYRTDRYDADVTLTTETPFDEQIALCRANVIRIHRKGRYEFPKALGSSSGRIRQLSARTAAMTRLLARPLRNFRELNRHLLLLLGDLGNPAPYEAWRERNEPIRVHTNACGDFTLLSRERWFKLGGYAELAMYSFHIDALFCLAAVADEMREEVLPGEVFHLEHGGGWAPEPGKAGSLQSDMAKRKVPIISNDQIEAWERQMRETRKAILFNHDDWGLKGESLPETVFGAAQAANL